MHSIYVYMFIAATQAAQQLSIIGTQQYRNPQHICIQGVPFWPDDFLRYTLLPAYWHACDCIAGAHSPVSLLYTESMVTAALHASGRPQRS